jgi:hypothetical protein
MKTLPLHILPYFSSLLLKRNPETRCKKTAGRYDKIKENQFHLRRDEKQFGFRATYCFYPQGIKVT